MELVQASDNRKLLMLWESRLYGNTSLRPVHVQVCQTLITHLPHLHCPKCLKCGYVVDPLHLHNPDCGYTKPPPQHTHRLLELYIYDVKHVNV